MTWRLRAISIGTAVRAANDVLHEHALEVVRFSPITGIREKPDRVNSEIAFQLLVGVDCHHV